MRTIVLGGTRFIGRALVNELMVAGHDLLLVHRGEHEHDEALADVPHLHVDRRNLGQVANELASFDASGLIDLSAMTGEDATVALAVLGEVPRKVVASSIDVYRAFSAVWAGTVTDSVPLTEDSPLRDGPSPDRGQVVEGYAYEPNRYEKRHVEAAYLARGGIACRLPMVYGPHDYKRREEFVLRRVRAGRKRIPVGPGTFLWSRGHVRELVRGLRLALELGRETEAYNLCEAQCASIRLWLQWIIESSGAEVEFVVVPNSALPSDLDITGDIPQHWLGSATKAEAELGWVHAEARSLVDDSVRWHMKNPPIGGDRDFSADEQALLAADH